MLPAEIDITMRTMLHVFAFAAERLLQLGRVVFVNMKSRVTQGRAFVVG